MTADARKPLSKVNRPTGDADGRMNEQNTFLRPYYEVRARPENNPLSLRTLPRRKLRIADEYATIGNRKDTRGKLVALIKKLRRISSEGFFLNIRRRFRANRSNSYSRAL